MGSSSGLQERLLAVMDRGAGASLSDQEFTELALAVFAYQYEHNQVYQAFCASRGRTPESVRNWIDIPAVPTDAFKTAPLLCGDPADAAVVFRTSGTTRGGERRGTHHLLDTALYRGALRAGFRHHLLPDRATMPIASLIPPPEELADSSLSFMIGDVIAELGAEGSDFYISGDRLDAERFVQAGERAIGAGQPLLIVGTSFAFVHLLDRMRELGVSLGLYGGSRVMDTGGFKGKSREVGRGELYGMIETALGVPASHIVNEYGMTEMSSQFYAGIVGSAPAAAESRMHEAPPWVRTIAVDPESLEPQPTGSTGVLRHVDLANLHSVMALQTADLGRVTDSGIELLGRATGAEARGCSIAMDELLAVVGRGGAGGFPNFSRED